ncbi:MAG: DUF6370 family protein [Phycisphaerae bacterium]
MKRELRTWLCTSVALVLLGAAVAGAQDYQHGKKVDKAKTDDKAKKPAMPEMNEEMMAWMKAGALNENHKRLNGMIGHWKTTVKTWMHGPGEPMMSTGKCENTWILKNHYVLTQYEGSFMGGTFEGAGITGYDNIRKQYFSNWIDSMSTSMMIEYGTFDEATNTFTYTGEFKSPTGNTMNSRSVIKIVNDDKSIFTMYHGEDAKNLLKVMEITYERDTTAKKTASAAMKVKMVKAGCAACTFKMPGVDECKLAVMIDGKPYLVTGSDVSAHKAGLCEGAKMAKCSGTLKDDTFAAASFEIVE